MGLNVLHSVAGLETVSGGVAGALVASVWQGVVLAATIWLALKALPRAGAATRFAIWMTGFGVLALLPALHLARGSSELAAHAVLARGPLVRLDARWSVALAAIWLAMSLYRTAGLVVNGVKLWGVWRRAVPMEVSAGVSSLLTDGLRRVELCTSEELERPSLIGFFAPRIVVPGWLFEKLTVGELRQIVMHEMEHLRRGDDWINLAQKVCLAVFPLNPVLMWMERRMCLERELACDAGVIRATGAPKAYATCLTTLAERSLDRRVAALALGAMERRSQLGERVYRILRGEKGLSRAQAGVVMSVAVVGLVAGAAELSRCPQLVSFAAPVKSAATAPAVPLVTIGTGKVQNVVYRDGAAGKTMGAHETLLKISAPAVTKVQAKKKTAKKHVVAAEPKVMVISEEVRSGYVQSYRRVVQEGPAPRMVMTVVDRDSGAEYTAIRTIDGWVVFPI
jgi:hypothetical protein